MAGTRIPDVLIVGAGGTGAVVAKECAEAGLGVVVLEAGGWHDPQRDFNGLEWDMLNPLDGVLRWGPRDRTEPPWPREREGISWLPQTAGVGGNTLHFGGNSPRAYVDAIDHGWPFPYEDLIEHYFAVEEALPVRVPDTLAPKDEAFARGCEIAGLRSLAGPDIRTSGWRVQPNAILPVASLPQGRTPSMRYPAIDGCTQCGSCLQGCRNPEGAPLERTAKRGTNVSYAPAALRTGRCEFRTDVFATRILTETRKGVVRARGVRYRDGSGRVQEQDAEMVVLAAGAIESPRLWLASSLTDDAIAGRYLTTHWFDYVSGVMPYDVDPAGGQTSMVRAEFPGYGFLESQGLGPMNTALSYALGPRGVDGEGPWATRGRTWGSALKRRMEAWARTLLIVVSVDDVAVRTNRVQLSADVRDVHNPAPKVTYGPTATTVRRRDHLAVKAAEILLAAGADPASIHRADAPASSIHMHGTLRMGNDPRTSVVDGDGQAHGIRDLFVADTSNFANGIGGPNPTLTAQAIARKIALGIVRRAR